MRFHRLSLRILSLVWMLLLVHAGWQLGWEALGTGSILNRFSPAWTAALLTYGLLGGLLGLAGLLTFLRPDTFAGRALFGKQRWIVNLGRLRWPLAGVLLVVPTALIYGPSSWIFVATSLRMVILLLATAGAAALLSDSPSALPKWLGISVLLSASIFVFTREFSQVNAYPLKLTWSEGNRLWDYSLYFGRGRYELAREFYWPSYLAPGRHGLWGLAYLLPGTPIWLVRLWDSVLWTVPYALLGWVLLRRHDGLTPLLGLGFTLWSLVFLAQGPIYAPLVLSAVVVVLGYDSDRPFQTAGITAVACFYAGISRWTWLVAPALWVGAWGLLDSDERLGFLPRIKKPALYGTAGLIGALASRYVMDLAVPKTGPFYQTALSQDLLWYRLLPSPTNPLGLLPGLALAIGPLLGLGWLALRHGWLRWDGLERLGIGAILLAFLGVGLVASVKIGGGNNLHNLDMLLVGLVLLAGRALAGLAGAVDLRQWTDDRWVQSLLALAVGIPAWFVLRTGVPYSLPPAETVQRHLEEVRSRLDAAAAEGEVLIVDQRQLLTFGQLEVPLVMDYELKHLFNQAMGSNEAYFDQFERDLRSERFQLIMTFPAKIQYQGRTHQFGEENDAFVRHVAEPLLEYYEPVVTFEETEIWLMAPREKGSESRVP